MAKGFKHGAGGGNPLNFKVVINPKPETAKENTIWVNTDVPIGAWYFSSTQPENLAEGDVWFPTGTSSPMAFNALKKQNIMVYPMSAKQMVSGSLVDVEAKIYQNSEWVWWNGELYDAGNEFISITGGWEQVNGTLTKHADNFTVSNLNASTSTYAAAYTANMIDLTDVKAINAIASGTLSAEGVSAGYMVVAKTKATSRTAAAEVALRAELKEYVLDVSSLTGSFYVGILVAGSKSMQHTATVQKVWVKG